jgi:hypothetical protein
MKIVTIKDINPGDEFIEGMPGIRHICTSKTEGGVHTKDEFGTTNTFSIKFNGYIRITEKSKTK